MATNPQHQADGNYDPAGSTQMFQAFVNEGGAPQAGAPQGTRRAPAPQPTSSGPRVGLIVGVVVALVVVAAAAWLALG